MRAKELYLAKNFEELQEIANEKKNMKTKNWAGSLTKLQQKAEQVLLDGDEECAYVMLLRYFNMLQLFKKSKDFHGQKSSVSNQLGGSTNVDRIMDTLERVASSLRVRYEERRSKQEQLESLESLSSIEFEPDIPARPTVINAKQMFEIIHDGKVSLLLIDCRPRSDFNESRIKYGSLLNVPEHALYKGTSVGAIMAELSEDMLPLWSARGIKENIILLDWNSSSCKIDTPIWILKDILENWDQIFDAKAPIQFLSGGYDYFKLCYPHDCINPHYEPKPVQSDDHSLDFITYPELEFGSSPQTRPKVPPKIDRSTKSNMLTKTSEEREMQFQEIMEEQEKVADKSLKTEKERLDAELSWNNTVSQDERKEFEFKIMQLESKSKDYREEAEQLKREKQELLEQARMVSAREAADLEEKAKLQQKLEEYERERQKVRQNQKKLAEERERKLAVEREKKREIQSLQEERELISIERPQVDRASKPLAMPEIDRKVRNFSPVRGGLGKGLTGLKNLGNTCYMNSIIQCLSHTKNLEDYFVKGVYIKHRNITSKTQCKIVEEVAAVIKALAEGHKFISSKDLKAIVGQYERNFRGYEQQDSHEFLTILMDWLHSDLQAISLANSPQSPFSPSEKAWYEFTKMRESIILRLFYGQIKSSVECLTCHKQSVTYDTFSNLSLELPSTSNRCHLVDCLNSYFEGERVTGWQCPNCNEKRDASKKLDISRLPGVLVIHLKRFHADLEMGGYRKKQNFVNFTLKNLDMRTFVARSEYGHVINQNSVYNLYAVSNHYGSMEGGHYTAYCKGGPANKWYKFDDHHVTSIDETEVISSAAYILFYQIEPRTR